MIAVDGLGQCGARGLDDLTFDRICEKPVIAVLDNLGRCHTTDPPVLA